MDMNTNFNTSAILQGAAAAAVALVITWSMSWSFFDSTRVTRWLSAADVAAAAAQAGTPDTSTLVGSFQAGLLQ